MESILLLRPDRNGDALKTLPVLRSLREAVGNQAELHLLCSHLNASVFTHEKGYSVHVLPKNWKRMKHETLLTSFRSNFPDRFDKAINLLCDPNADVDELLSWLLAKQKWSGSLKDEKPWHEIKKLELPESDPAGRDETENIGLLVSQALSLKLDPSLHSRSPVLSPEDEQEAFEKMGPKDGRWLGLCPFAGEPHRSHSIKRWEKFATRLTKQAAFEKFFLFGSPSDYDRLEKLRLACSETERVELCFPSTFRTLGAYLKRLDGVIAVDSGPLHLALALGVRSLGILSGGDVERWFPRLGEGDVIVRRGLFHRFPSVFEMIRAFDRWKPASA